MSLKDTPHFDFLGKRRYAFILSVVFAIIGLIAAVSIPLGKANLGTDFSGGISTQFRFERPVVVEEVRGLLEKGGFADADIQEFSGASKILIRVKRTDGDLGAISKAIGDIFSTSFSDNPFVIDSTSEVGPTVGKRLQRDAFWAIVISLCGIFFYIGWRFEFRFGIAAVAATFHDVLAVLGILFVINKEINLLVITALLTIAGYSINDSVVVFDRIRENLRRKGKSKEEFVPLINRSINEMFRRTVVTSGTTLLVLLALNILGGEVIHDFSLTLILGVIIGTYSSIFVASPLLLIWKSEGKLSQED
jgi:preprotein translocase subunit SecF